jgi:hypothetical protein
MALRTHVTWRMNNMHFVRFHVLTAASMKMTAFWDVALCSLVAIDVSEVRTAFIALMFEAIRTSGTSVYFTRLHGATSQKAVVFIGSVAAVQRRSHILSTWTATSVPNITCCSQQNVRYHRTKQEQDGSE